MNHSITKGAAALTILLLCSCGGHYEPAAESTEPSVIQNSLYDPSAPVIEFTTETENADGTPEYYLFDDNPEHLNPRYLADGSSPSSIAHFEDLQPGIYTVFSYHHRGDSVSPEADLYFDAAFSSSAGGEFKILGIGLDHDWDWNQAWANYTNTAVSLPEYYKTFSCTCHDGCSHGQESCIHPDCPAVVRGEIKYPRTQEIDHLNTITSVNSGSPLLLSDCIDWIRNNDINHFRYTGYDEPMWLYMTFEITSGTITFDTLAYTSKNKALNNFPILAKGAFDNEPQYKGIAYNSPVVTSESYFTISSDTPPGAIPVTVRNMRSPDGCTIQNGTFATFVNTWREEQPIAAESDLMLLQYHDEKKSEQYGENVANTSNIWNFDAFHTKCYEETPENSSFLRSYGISTGDDFIPNSEMSLVNYPTGSEISDDNFYKYTACNLGNFGVTTRYIIHVSNTDDVPRTFSFTMKSIAGQVYRYSQASAVGSIIADDGGTYIMKKFDSDPAEDPDSKTDPKERLSAEEYGDTLSFNIDAQTENTITIEITTLTGCTAPMHNTFSVD
ncbi:MAG: hypothetical protein ACI4TH_08105 [Candidatus Ornithomonoglobus sp.]